LAVQIFENCQCRCCSRSCTHSYQMIRGFESLSQRFRKVCLNSLYKYEGPLQLFPEIDHTLLFFIRFVMVFCTSISPFPFTHLLSNTCGLKHTTAHGWTTKQLLICYVSRCFLMQHSCRFYILSSSSCIETGSVNVRSYLERETRKKEKNTFFRNTDL
jgi:hypothetical protein